MSRLLRSLLPLFAFAAPSAQAAAVSLNAAGVIQHGPRTLKRVALTFDADMTRGMQQNLKSGRVKSYYNAAVVDALTSTHTPATFFLAGMWAQVYPQQAKMLAQNPLFEIGNHSYDHPGFSQPCYGLPSVPEAAKRSNMAQAQTAIAAATGVTPKFFRFPGGCATASDVKIAESLGMKVVHWDVIGGDVNQHSAAQVVRHSTTGVQNGSIIVLHVSGGHAPMTGKALPDIIRILKGQGYEFVTVGQLLGN